MELEQSTSRNMDTNASLVNQQSFEEKVQNPLLPQQDDQPCPTCGNQTRTNPNNGSSLSFVYALGRIEPRTPSIGVQKELAQVIGQADTAGLTDRQVLHDVLKRPENRYLVRQLCWVMTISDLDTYILIPRDPVNLDLLVETLRRDPGPLDLDVAIGIKGPNAPFEMCNGLMIPILGFDQIYSFDRASFLQSIPRPEEIPEEEFKASSEEVLNRIMRMADNVGATDEDRSLNYLAMRYPAIYERTAKGFRNNESLTGVEVRSSRLSGTRRIVSVVFSYTHRQTGVTEKSFVRVDVSEEFPFLVTKLSPYFEL